MHNTATAAACYAKCARNGSHPFIDDEVEPSSKQVKTSCRRRPSRAYRRPVSWRTHISAIPRGRRPAHKHHSVSNSTNTKDGKMLLKKNKNEQLQGSPASVSVSVIKSASISVSKAVSGAAPGAPPDISVPASTTADSCPAADLVEATVVHCLLYQYHKLPGSGPGSGPVSGP